MNDCLLAVVFEGSFRAVQPDLGGDRRVTFEWHRSQGPAGPVPKSEKPGGDGSLGFLARPLPWKLTLGLRRGSPITRVKQRAIDYRGGLVTSRVPGACPFLRYRVELVFADLMAVFGLKFAKRCWGISGAISDSA